jgi:hypothetical protein
MQPTVLGAGALLLLLLEVSVESVASAGVDASEVGTAVGG